MFGYVTASMGELTQEQRQRYMGCYCGICRAIGRNSSGPSRLSLNFDMVFLALLLSSLYEPEEEQEDRRCLLHPLSRRPGFRSEAVSYAADMNVALAYFSADDHWRDDRRPDALALRKLLKKQYPEISRRCPRQCRAMEACIRELSRLEKEACSNPDLPANCFGQLMAELFVWKQDLWEPYLREMGEALGRFIYLMDAATDFEKDRRKGRYNPFVSLGEADRQRWEEYLVLEMGRCTRSYEALPLVQDKALLDNILYSGVWIRYRQRKAHRGAQEEPT